MSVYSVSEELDSSSFDEWYQLEMQIRRNFSLEVQDFHIQKLDDGLVLEGRTKSYFIKQAAQHAVMKATKLPIRANNIVVG